MQCTERLAEIINIVLSSKNAKHFVNVIVAAKATHIAETQRRSDELATKPGWELLTMLKFSSEYAEIKTEKSAMKPFYYDNRWKTEEAFVNFLGQKENSVEWWFKNGVRDATFFASKDEEDGALKLFYVDFIVKFKGDKIGLFDIKGGQAIKDAKDQSDGLQGYDKAHKDIIGGIVVYTKSKNFSGRRMYYTGNSKDLVPGEFTNWDLMEI